MSGGETVLVTGGSGYIGGWCVASLLQRGYVVRATVRDLAKEGAARAAIANIADPGNRLSFHAANLTADAGWDEAAAGCDYVLHVASPLGVADPKDPNDLIVPAREGAKRAIGAAIRAGVKRVVMTSSVAAANKGVGGSDWLSDETVWTDPQTPKLSAYALSKTLAERAAWEFVAREGGGLELSVINPTGVFGPVLGPDFSGSIEIIKALLDGRMPAVPRIYFGLVDVRDVADLHLRAMTAPAASGERFIAVAGETMSILEIAKVLRRELGSAARRVPRFQAPDWVVRLAARRNPMLRYALPMLGKVRRATSAKARQVLGWTPRSNDEMILATAESLIRLGVVKP